MSSFLNPRKKRQGNIRITISYQWYFYTLIQGSHRLCKNIFHDFSMTVSQFSMTTQTFYTDAKFLNVNKKGTNSQGQKNGKIPWLITKFFIIARTKCNCFSRQELSHPGGVQLNIFQGGLRWQFTVTYIYSRQCCLSLSDFCSHQSQDSFQFGEAST